MSKVYGYCQPVSCHGGLWTVDYVPGARTADILFNGHAVDVIQVRDWDWSRTVGEQASYVPSPSLVLSRLLAYVAADGAAAVDSLS